MSAAGQMSLLAEVSPTSRVDDPVTSLEALPSGAAITELQRKVLDEHRRAARIGLTDDELVGFFPLEHPGSVIKRRGELTDEGLLVATEQKRKTRRGRRAVVWSIPGGGVRDVADVR